MTTRPRAYSMKRAWISCSWAIRWHGCAWIREHAAGDARGNVHHTRAVRRGTRHALLVADMPYGSYHDDPMEAVRNAVRFVKEGGAEAVKIEGGERRMELIARLVEAEIPVMGHIGLTPQSVNAFGGFRVQGKTEKRREQLARCSRRGSRRRILHRAGIDSARSRGARITPSCAFPRSASARDPTAMGKSW